MTWAVLPQPEHAGGEIGYVFHPDASGHGYAGEACAALLALAFRELGLHRVTARLDSRNDASARLCVRLGMRQEAHLVRSEMFKGAWSDELVFAILAEECPPLEPAAPTRPPEGYSDTGAAGDEQLLPEG